mgnify:CR=1 FL=1
MKKVCLAGCGRLGHVIADGLMAGKVPGAELTAVLVQTAEKAEKLQAELGCLVTTDLQELLSAKPAYVIESAGNGVVRQITVPVLEAGADLIVLSTSIFGESAFYDQARAAATRYGRQIHLAHGVIGGLDVVETAAMMGEVTAGLTKRKFSKGSARSDAALDALADEFHATAAEAMEQSGSIECGNFSRFSRRKSGEDRGSCFSSRDGRLHYKVRWHIRRGSLLYAIGRFGSGFGGVERSCNASQAHIPDRFLIYIIIKHIPG